LYLYVVIVDDTAILQPHCSYEIQRWQKGFYTLLRDDHSSNEYALDVIIHFNVHNVKQLQGGFISYVARDADEEVRWFISVIWLIFMYFHEANVLHQIIAVPEVGHITSLLDDLISLNPFYICNTFHLLSKNLNTQNYNCT
jgi:hypothetical protein